MRTKVCGAQLHGDLVQWIETISGQHLLECNQCGKCSAGCPVASAMDMLPSQVIRLVQLGLSEALEAQAIWMCASCLTCVTRCPKGVDLPRIMEALRQIHLRRGDELLSPDDLSASLAASLPPMALIAGFRKMS
jgi:heterodisulfide reductase subunit C2